MGFNMAIGELNVQRGTRLDLCGTTQHDAVFPTDKRKAPCQHVLIAKRREQLALRI